PRVRVAAALSKPCAVLLLEPSIKQHRAAVGMGLSLGWRTFALERKRASAILPRSDWGVLDSGTEGDHRPVSTTRRLLSKEHGTYRGRRQSRWLRAAPTALLFERALNTRLVKSNSQSA